ncbi:MAG: hypothetical protein Q9166_004649 [cf. Caloplaca sp. 2 TL-2023]
MSPTKHLPRLLSAPPEIREQIYNELLYDRESSFFQLLLVNRQISREIKPWTFKRPLTFNGQHSLFRWLSTVDPDYLRNVVDVRFSLHDIDPEKIVGALGERLKSATTEAHDTPRNHYEEAFRYEATHITKALHRFRNLKSFTLLESAGPDPHPGLKMLVMFAAGILQEFALHSFQASSNVFEGLSRNKTAGCIGHSYISKVQNLQITKYNFRGTLSFPAYLSLFPNLTTLGICGEGLSTLQDLYESECTVLGHGGLSRVQKLTLCLYSYDSLAKAKSKTIERFLIAVQGEVKSLRTFKLLCNHGIHCNSGTMQQVLRILESSELTHVETEHRWTPLPDQYHRYPPSIASIAIRFIDHYDFIKWMPNFNFAIRSPRFFVDHPHLEEILIYLQPTAYDQVKKHGTHQSTLVEKCRKHGVKFRIISKDVSCEHKERAKSLKLPPDWPPKALYRCH